MNAITETVTTPECPHGRPRSLCGVCASVGAFDRRDRCYCDECVTDRRNDAIDDMANTLEGDWVGIIRRRQRPDCHMDSFIAWMRADEDRADLLDRVVCGASLGPVSLRRCRAEFDADASRLADLAAAYLKAAGQAVLEEPAARVIDDIGEYAWIQRRAADLMEHSQ